MTNRSGVSASEALARLREGNQRYVSQQVRATGMSRVTRRAELAEGQRPFAIVLGCSDSRVPVEIVLDQDLGDLFVVRLAGNIVAPAAVASIEFAATRFGASLIVVMGHSGCGAVRATLEELADRGIGSAGSNPILGQIAPHITGLFGAEKKPSLDSLMPPCVRANIDASVDELTGGSAVLARLAREDGLVVLGAQYDMETGVVDFYASDGVS